MLKKVRGIIWSTCHNLTHFDSIMAANFLPCALAILLVSEKWDELL